MGSTPPDSNKLEVETVVSLKYLNGFWKFAFE